MADVAKKLATLVGKGGKRPTTYTGTVVSVGGRYRVLLDGATEPTLCLPEVKAVTGDRVTVEIRNHVATVKGNITHPTTDDAQANEALTQAGIAADAATQAQTDAGTAAQAATTASQAATNAQQSATTAAGAATSAQASATSAATNAATANQAASTALVNLAVIEDVAGTLAWISEHGSYVLTTDTTVQDGTVYFELDSGDYVPIATPDPSANPSQEGWYVLDITDSQSDYIMAHLAVTSAGLWVLPSGIGQASDAQHAAGYKALLASNGMSIFDGSGMIVASYGAETAFYDGLGSAAANVIAKFGRQGARIGYEGETHVNVEPTRFGILNGSDRLYEVKYEGELVSIYGGGIGAAAGTDYTNAYIEALCARLNDGYTVDLTTMKVLLPNGLDSGMTVTLSSGDTYDVLDSDGEQFDSGSYAGILYGSTDELFSPDFVMTPAAEDKGAPIHEELGGVALDFADGRMSVNGDTSIDGDVSVGGGITVASHTSPIGTMLTDSDTVSVLNNSGTSIASVTLDPGTWSIEGNVGFAENSTGRRVIDLATGSGSVTDAVLRQTGESKQAVSGGITASHTGWITTRTSRTTVYLNVYQNSGAALSVTGYIRAVRIA
ncbi:MAG: hypothetical protein IKF78_00280 [Atopobiaceae bacterium]|nr:hypothetical protein [Atopobiaceae bacterium]